MKQLYLSLLIIIALTSHGQVPNSFLLLDNFTRNDSIKVGVPAGSTYEYWLEYGEVNFGCLGTSCTRLKTNSMEMSRYDWNGMGCFANSAKAANIEMTFKYPTVFSTSPGKLEWYFNMQQSLADPTGFNVGQDGIAFVIGSTASNPTSSPSGYAVIFGDATTDNIRLVSFLSNFNNGAFTNIISVPPPASKSAHMSIRVTYNPCNNEWSLRVRDDGAAFADPSTITGTALAGETAINTTFTSQNLPWIGGIWNHGSSNSIAKFDNIYIPNAATIASYVWNGSNGTDFQLAANWTPARNCTNVGDRLLFNALTPANAVLTNVPSQTIKQLWISDNRSVTLKDVVNTLPTVISITGAAGADLKIDAGSTLVLDVTGTTQDAMQLSMGSGATGSIAGNVIFTNTTSNMANPHRLFAADANAISVTNGGLIKAQYLSGNPFGNSGTPNTINFNAGSAYEARDGNDPFGLTAPASKVIFNRGSVYRHFVAAQPALFGRTYANFEFEGILDVTLGSATYAWTTDTLKILNGSLLLNGSANGEAVNTNIKGDLVVYPGALFNYDPSTASTLTFNSNFATQKIISAANLQLGKQLTVKLNSSFANPQLSVENELDLAGVLQVALGTLHLNANITLRSDAMRTASVAAVTGNISYGAGRFVVERYIPAHKAWQFLAVPTTTGQTTKDAWQEGNAPYLNSKPGFGTLITSNIAGNGFDILTPAGPSMKTYNATNNTWMGVPNTDVDPIANKKGYMLLVRGDRAVSQYNAPATATILRTTGKIFSPGINAPPATTVLAGKFESIGNPYASAIDFNLVTKTGGVQNTFYVWDPQLTGGASAYGLGGIQTFIFNGTSYDVIPGGGSYVGTNRSIESGQAFFARCTSPNGTINFPENCKVNTSNLVTRGGDLEMDQLRANLYVFINNKPVLLDGVRSDFSDGFTNEVDQQDAYKMSTTGESLSISRADSSLVVERRSTFVASDTIFYKMEKLRKQQYQIQFIRKNFVLGEAKIYLVDQWLQTRTLLNIMDTANIAFSVTTDSGSYASNRFYVVLIAENSLPTNDLAGITLQPNPVINKTIRLVLKSQPLGAYQLTLVNSMGQAIYKSLFEVRTAPSTSVFKLPKWVASGSYKMIISKEGIKKKVISLMIL